MTVALAGDFGKPRPALVIQADRFDATGTVAVLLMSGTLVDAPLIRRTIEPTPENGLRKRSQVMVDKIVAVRRDRIGDVIGCFDAKAMIGVTRALAVFLAIA